MAGEEIFGIHWNASTFEIRMKTIEKITKLNQGQVFSKKRYNVRMITKSGMRFVVLNSSQVLF
jgi:hypothetical protein